MMENQGMRGVVRDLRTLFVSGSVGGLTDVQLLERFIGRGDEGAFEALTTRHGPMVWGVCKRLLRNHQDAEDAFQATFLILARKAPSVQPREMLANWLYGVAYRTASKARSTRFKRETRERTIETFPEPHTPSRACNNDLGDRLDRELSRLPDKYRVPILLCDLQEKSHKDAALLLGWPIGTVSGRLSRGRSLLAKRLKTKANTPSGSVLTVLLSQNVVAGSLPFRLVESTSSAASLIALSRTATLGIVSSQVAVLTEGVMKSMFVTKIKIATAAAVSGFALFAGGTGLGLMAQTGDKKPGQDSVAVETLAKPYALVQPYVGKPGQDSSIGVEAVRPSSDSDELALDGLQPPASDDVPAADPTRRAAASSDEPPPATAGDAPPPSDQPVAKGAASDAPPPASSSDARPSRARSRKTAVTPARESPAGLPDSDRRVPDQDIDFDGKPAVVEGTRNPSRRSASNDTFRLGEIDIELQGNARNKLPEAPVAGDLFGSVNDDLGELELAIAKGVMEAEESVKGKSREEVHQIAEEVAEVLKEERLKIRTMEACLRRLVRVRDNYPGKTIAPSDRSVGQGTPFRLHGGLGP